MGREERRHPKLQPKSAKQRSGDFGKKTCFVCIIRNKIFFPLFLLDFVSRKMVLDTHQHIVSDKVVSYYVMFKKTNKEKVKRRPQ